MFKPIITYLRESGMTTKQISAYCDCSEGAIDSLYHGRTDDPRYSLGVKLLKLEKKRKKYMKSLES